MKTTASAGRRSLPTSPFNFPAADAGPHEVYTVNDRVNHDRFGLGVVVAVEGTIALRADFGSGIVQRITLPSSKLTKL